MADVRVELDSAGIAALFKSAGMQQYLGQVGEAVAGRAASGGGKYAARVHNASHTAIANVYADDQEAARNNYRQNTLLKAVGSIGLPDKKPHL